VLMAPDSWKQLFANTVAQAKSGEIPPARLDDAVRRILRVKLRMHLFDEGRPSSRPVAGKFELLGSPEHRAVARRAVRESLVLLKNSDHLLPLQPGKNVLVAGDGADSIGKQSGGWTITWQGTGVTNKDFPHGETIYSGIRSAVTAAGGTTYLSPNGTFVKKPDVAIVVFGEDPYAEFQGDMGSVEYSPGDKPDLKLLRTLRAQGIPVVAVFLSGRPLWVNSEINASDAFIAAWLPGTEGGGIADVIFKATDGSTPHDFHGRLSFSWPRNPQQTAVNRGDKGTPPLFAYGYGLTYSDNGNLNKLSEDAGTADSTAVDTRLFFTAGKPGPGWRWTAKENAEYKDVPSGVGVTSGGRLRMSATDRAAQEDARRIQWSGSGVATVALGARMPIDLQRETNGQLSLGFDYKVDLVPTTDVTARVECGAGCEGAVELTGTLRSAPVGQWRHAKIPLLCFAKAGARMAAITRPFALSTTGQLGLSVANIRLETGTDGLTPCAQ
jgi:beta-glucosidase